MPETEYNNNMCRVCLQEHKDDFESLFADEMNKNELSELGLLYEELFHISIQVDEHHPEYLCNYCNLQLKLFHKLKSKAAESYVKFSEYANSKVNDVLSDMELSCDETEELKFELIECRCEFVGCENTTEISALDCEDEETDTETVTKPDLNATTRTESTRDFPCKKCDKVFEKRAQLIKHRQAAHKIIKYACTLCPRKYLSKESLEAHINTHKGLPAYQCNLCDKTFKTKLLYIYHNQGHQNEKNAQCDLCGKGFRNKFDLRSHLRSHTDERKYECDICGKKFRAHTNLTNHRYAHVGKTLECEFCPQKFTSPPALKRHLKTIHSEERSFTCFICNKQFKRIDHLKLHQKNH